MSKMMRGYTALCFLFLLGLSYLAWANPELFKLKTLIEQYQAQLAIVMLALPLFIIGMWLKSRISHKAKADLAQDLNQADQTQLGLKEKKEAVASRPLPIEILQQTLKTRYEWGWRSAKPWIMVTGDEAELEVFAPSLFAQGWLETPDALLLRGASSQDNNTEWLKAVRGLRRFHWRAPVDAVILVSHPDRKSMEWAQTLAEQNKTLAWAAPLYWLRLRPAALGEQTLNQTEAIAVTWPMTRLLSDKKEDKESLKRWLHELSVRGVTPLLLNHKHTFIAALAQYLHKQNGFDELQQEAHDLLRYARNGLPLRSILFAPRMAPITVAGNFFPLDTSPSLQYVLQDCRRDKGERTAWTWPQGITLGITALLLSGLAAAVVSYQGNLRLVKEAQALSRAALSAKPNTPYGLRSALALQHKLEQLEYQAQHGTPWHLRMGLGQQAKAQRALFESYSKVAQENIAQPLQTALSAELQMLAGLPAEQMEDDHLARAGYEQLKAYLMLAMPTKAEAPFLKKQLPPFYQSSEAMPAGLWNDLSQQLLPFYIDRLKSHPEWAIQVDEQLVNSARQTLLTQIGLKNAEDSLYQELITEANSKYAQLSLPALLAGRDARGLFGSKQSVPGAYTRQAWEGDVEKNIKRLSEDRGVRVDWVLADSNTDTSNTEKKDPKALQAQLRARYFAEFASAWTGFLNSIQWTQVNTIPSAIEQLSQLADMQQSPLVALMNSVQYQGQTAKPVPQLADALVNKAKNLLNTTPEAPQIAIPKAGPLDDAFGPLLALMSTEASNSGDAELSLSRYLTRVTAIRLKLQQIMANPAPETLARSLAQAVLQGKTSEFVDTRNYAGLVAASTGAQWGTFAQSVFNQPLDQAWQAILAPAARSINESWQTSVLLPWRGSFEARYPFKNVNNDASFPELARFLKPDTGLIDGFVNSQLNGVLVKQGDQWEPNQLAPQGLTFNVEFLNTLNQLSRLSSRLFVEGNAGYRFDLQPQMGKGVVKTDLQIDSTQLIYMNQSPSWHEITWPSSDPQPSAQLSWVSQQAGLKLYFRDKGRWSFLRLLEKAKVKQLDNARYWLTWQAPDGGEPINYLMRTQVGEGPFELLKLRQFKMPQSVFVIKGAEGAKGPVVKAVAKPIVKSKEKKK